MEKTLEEQRSDLIRRLRELDEARKKNVGPKPLHYTDEKGRVHFIPRHKIFVFGSNLAGVHGRGAALYASRNFDAVYGVGQGPTGRAYAIPTKENPRARLVLCRIQGYVEQFIQYATQHPELEFYVTKVGCGLAGYTEKDIAPMFYEAPINCQLPEGWPSRAAEEAAIEAEHDDILQQVHEEQALEAQGESDEDADPTLQAGSERWPDLLDGETGEEADHGVLRADGEAVPPSSEGQPVDAEDVHGSGERSQ